MLDRVLRAAAAGDAARAAAAGARDPGRKARAGAVQCRCSRREQPSWTDWTGWTRGQGRNPRKYGSAEDTDLEQISLGGPRIKHLRALFVIESGVQTRSRTLSVLTASEYRS